MSELIVYGFCEANCKHRVLTLDQTVELIQEMASSGFQVPEGYIPKTAVNAIIDQNTGKELAVFVGTQEEYNLWNGDKENVFAIITDDTTLKQLRERLSSVEANASVITKTIENILDGSIAVHNAKYASADTTKGTIEERLTRLGFKSGTITSPADSGISISADSNAVYRQGNYVLIPKLKVYMNNNTSLPSNTLIATMPENFRPPKEIKSSARLLYSADVESQYGVYCTVYISTTGRITIDNGSSSTLPMTAVLIENIGYEVNPIT